MPFQKSINQSLKQLLTKIQANIIPKMSIRYSYIIGVALICASCGKSDEKRPSLEQTRAAIEVRDAWRDELKPLEITASGAIAGADRIGVRLNSDGKTDFLAFVGNTD